MLALSRGAGAGDERVEAILLARQVNLALGGPFVAPWEVKDLPADFIDAAVGVTQRLPGFVAARQGMDAKLAEWRQRASGKVH